MAQTYTSILLHIVFSTKGRSPIIRPDLQPDLFGYMGGIARNLESPILRIGGVEDHLHMLVSLSKKLAVSDLLLNLKRDSSKWANAREDNHEHFAWQEGYSAFSIGESAVPALTRYIDGQRDHHKTVSFQDEIRALAKKYGITLDERYAWG